MAGRTRVLILRLREGGVLLVAPALIMPWPRLLSTQAQRLQEHGLRQVLTDPSALARLRAEFGQLIGAPSSRRAAMASAEELVTALLTAARSGRVTVIFGYGEPKASMGKPGDLVELFRGHPVVDPAARGVRVPTLDPSKEMPEQGTPLPQGFEERLFWVCGRSLLYMSDDEAVKMREFFDGPALATSVGLLNMWATSHVIGIGFVVDGALFAAAVWRLGSAALLAFEQLKDFFDDTRDATSWAELDEASRSLASAAVGLGPVLMRQLLRRVGARVGSQGAAEVRQGSTGARVGKPAVKPEPRVQA